MLAQHGAANQPGGLAGRSARGGAAQARQPTAGPAWPAQAGGARAAQGGRAAQRTARGPSASSGPARQHEAGPGGRTWPNVKWWRFILRENPYILLKLLRGTNVLFT